MNIKIIKSTFNWAIFCVLVVSSSLISVLNNPPKLDAASKNTLLGVAQACNGVAGIGNFDNGLGTSEDLKTCRDYEQKLKAEAGCGGLLYSLDVHPDSDDTSVVYQKWFIRPSAYKDCYNKTSTQLNRFKSGGICVVGAKGSANNKRCKDNQGNLKEILGCDDLIYDSGNRYRVKPNARSACESKLNEVGNFHLTIARPDGSTYTANVAVKDIGSSKDTENIGDASGGGPTNSKDQADCDAAGSGFNLSWIVCPIIDAGVNMSDWVFSNLVQPLLEDVPVGTGGSYNKVWQTFRIFGNILLVGALLLMVFAQNTGRFVDAYTIKRMAPRIVIGAIAINISIYLCIAAVDITNVIGKGLGQTLVGPFASGFNPSDHGIQLESNFEGTVVGLFGVGFLAALLGAGGILFATGLVGAAAVSILGLLLPTIITVVLIALAVLFTLIIRQALIIFLVIISPVAIALFILPNTEKYFRQWWGLFLKTLLVYPIIAILFAMSNIMTIILLSASVRSGDSIGIAQIIAAVLVAFAPLVLIPFSFKFAGGAIGAVMNAAQGQAANLSARTRKRIETSRQDPNSWLGGAANRMRVGRREHGLTGGQVISGVRGGTRARMGGRSFASGYAAESRVKSRGAAYDEATAFMENNEAFKSFSGNDDALHAFQHGSNESEVREMLRRRGYSGQSLDDNTASIMRAKSKVGERAGQIAAVRSQAKTGTGWEDNAQMLEEIAIASGGDMSLAGRTLAEARGSAMQSGRMELGSSSFNTQMIAMGNLNTARLNGGMVGGHHYGADEANHEIMESVIDSVGSGQAVYGKPQSARAIATAHRDKISGLIHSLSTGTATSIDGEQRVANSRDVKQALASANGVHDAMSNASPQNAREFANVLMGSGLDVANMLPEARASLGPAFAEQNTGQSSVGPEGNLTVRQAMQNMAGRDQEYDEMRRDFASQTLAEANQSQQVRAQQVAQQQQGTPGIHPPTPPGTLPT